MTRTAYRGMVIGSLSGAVGLLATGQCWKRAAPLLNPPGQDPPQHDQNVISPFGQRYQPDESSTAALRRTLCEEVEGKEPDQQAETALSKTLHGGFGRLGGAGLWALGREGMLPLLGLGNAPRASNLREHAGRVSTGPGALRIRGAM